MPLLLLPYATTTQALSATTAQVIHGTEPYLTFDNGVTKVTTTDALLGITLSDGTNITPAINTSTAANPIKLLRDGDSFADITMSVPANVNSIALNALIGAPNNYWGDDDGDGQGADGITVTGNLSVRITDKDDQTVRRDTVLSICGAPYKMVITSTDGSLTTRYGVPNSRSFAGSNVTYYINPKSDIGICYVQPSLYLIFSDYAGTADIWKQNKGFLVQSTSPSSYGRNFPTTGANNLYFDLLIEGINAATLTWPTVTQGGITATMTPSPANANNIRVTLTGPVATASQQSSATPGSVATPTLPQTFVLVGKDSSNNEVLKYGFVLKQWFVNRGRKDYLITNTLSWCSSIGYRLPQVKDLTNGICPSTDNDCSGAVGGTPSSSGNRYQRNIGAGLLTEWGDLGMYLSANFDDGGDFAFQLYWANTGSKYFKINVYDGRNYGAVTPSHVNSDRVHVVCVYP